MTASGWDYRDEIADARRHAERTGQPHATDCRCTECARDNASPKER